MFEACLLRAFRKKVKRESLFRWPVVFLNLAYDLKPPDGAP
jgi:hypothetical protein